MGLHVIEKKHLSAQGMLTKVRSIFKQIEPLKDPRGAKTEISLADCLMSALALFGLKFPSLLQFNDSRNDEVIKHNLKTLYDVEKAPDDTTMRQRLDKVDPRSLRPAFSAIFSIIQRGKVLEDYRFLGKYLLIPCDGTNMFSSEDVHCENCCEKHHKDGKGYQFEHNFGHGYKNLSHVFGLLLFLAFLIDQVQQRCCGLFQAALVKMKRKIRFWERLRAVFLEFHIDSWADLFLWMAGRRKKIRLRELLDTS